MTRRRLTADEIALWHKVVEQTERLHPDRALPPPARPKPKPVKSPVARISAASDSAPARKPNAKASVRATEAPRMDNKAYVRMKRGRLVPEGRIDLHGMTLDAAHPALVRFILTAQAAGKRLVLVITGKGKQGDDGSFFAAPRGILRRQVPHWLEIPPLAQAVLEVTAAHIRHGGDGAFYVYLKRNR